VAQVERAAGVGLQVHLLRAHAVADLGTSAAVAGDRSRCAWSSSLGDNPIRLRSEATLAELPTDFVNV
jgi:hypothetical protein